MSKRFDVIVFGATGFVGKQTAQQLDKLAKPDIKMAIAGRRLDALRALAATLKRPVECVVADSTNAATIDAMCASAKVLVTTAGPFLDYGSPVVEACVKHGTHYLDITGETPWVRDMINQHQAAALQSRAKLVPFAGYDSVPSDLAAWLAIHALSSKAREGEVTVEVFHRAVGGFNGGTLATALLLAERGRFKETTRPFLLNDDHSRETNERDLAKVGPPRNLPHRGRVFPAPFFMGPVNSRVVRRSVELAQRFSQPYAQQVRYQEYWGAKSKAEAIAIVAIMGVFFKLVSSALGRSLIRTLGPKPGQGPSKAKMDGGRFEAIAVAKAANGETSSARVAGPGDPGNRVTVQCLVQATLCLVEDQSQLPERYGFLTPTAAFGERLVERLRASGMTLTAERMSSD